jgi:hypothetical protein
MAAMKFGRLILLGTINLMLSIFIGCKKDPNARIDKLENTSAFKEIVLDDAFDLTIYQDSVYSIEINAHEDFIEEIEYTIVDSVLNIQNNSGKRWRNPETNKISITIHCDRPRLIQANESCFIKTGNPIVSNELGLVVYGKLNQADLELNGNVFYFWNNHPCGGKLILRGKTDQLKLWSFAIMQVDASSCESRYGLVENFSKGYCKVNISEKLDYSLQGEGNILLKGNPTLQLLKQTSTGSLIRE